MEQNSEIEKQLWEYIDGVCDGADGQRISILITTHAAWKEKYQELTALHKSIAFLDAEQPSLRFTKNVMDAVNAVHIAPVTNKYINIGIIRGIAALFIVAITAALGYAIATAKWDTGNVESFSKLNLSTFFSSNFFEAVICVNIVLGLAFLDIILRKEKLGRTG